MSLKAFHIVFITASTLLTFGFSAWLVWNYVNTGGWMNLVGAAAVAGAGVGLLVYGKYFLKKFKHLGYI